MITEHPLHGTIDIQTPDYTAMGFVLGLSRLGDKLGDGSTGQAWTSWVNAVSSITIRRGFIRRGIGLRTDVGIMTFILVDAEDPNRGGFFRPGLPVRAVSRVTTSDGTTLRPIFTGKVGDVGAAYPLDKSTGKMRTAVTITASDAVAVHTNTPRYGAIVSNGSETFEERIARLEASARVPIVVPPIGDPREVYAF